MLRVVRVVRMRTGVCVCSVYGLGVRMVHVLRSVELRAERADGADGTRMVLVCGVCVCSFVRVVRVRSESVRVKRRPVDSIS